ncbi:MAG: hypothetical protein QM537_08615 [Candidatus Symbiobacter sp.]|nr:hypothetical protein [Candidatus Symbiobacter sp.]
MRNSAMNWVNQTHKEGWANKLDSYSVAAGIGLITHFAGHLDLTWREVVCLIISIIGCEIASSLLRKDRK